MDYKRFYDLVREEQDRLLHEDILEDGRLCKALAACYELQDYLADCIAERIEREGEWYPELEWDDLDNQVL